MKPLIPFSFPATQNHGCSIFHPLSFFILLYFPSRCEKKTNFIFIGFSHTVPKLSQLHLDFFFQLAYFLFHHCKIQLKILQASQNTSAVLIAHGRLYQKKTFFVRFPKHQRRQKLTAYHPINLFHMYLCSAFPVSFFSFHRYLLGHFPKCFHKCSSIQWFQNIL